MKHLLITLLLLSLCAPALAQIPSSKSSGVIANLTAVTYNSYADLAQTYIKVAQQKELVFDVSLEGTIVTDTLVRSKNGKADTSTAEAAIEARVFLQKVIGTDADGNPVVSEERIYAYPDGEGGGVVFLKRTQELMGKFQGVFEQCAEWDDAGTTCLTFQDNSATGNDCVSVNPETNAVTVDSNCALDYEEVQLVLDTTSANAFNFIVANLDSGEYLVTLQASVTSNSDYTNGDSRAMGLIRWGSMVIDESRFIQGADGTYPSGQ